MHNCKLGWDSIMQADHSEYWRGTCLQRGLKAPPTSLLPLQKGENVIQAKDVNQVLKERQWGWGEEIAFTRKSQGGPQGYLPLLLQEAGSCSLPPKAEWTLGRAQGNNRPVVGLRSKSPHGLTYGSVASVPG